MIQKLDHNSGLLAKNQREISSNKFRRLLWPLGEGKCGKGGGKWYKESGKCIIKSRIEFPDLILMTLDTPHGPIKVFEKMPKKCGENEGENYFFPTLVFNSKTRSQFRSACKKSERNLQ